MMTAACGGGDGGSAADPATTSPTIQAPTTTTVEVDTTTSVAPSTTTAITEPVEALVRNGSAYTVTWEALVSEPFYAVPAATSVDPFYFIHTMEADGFYLAFEMYTTGYGQEWAGELGEVAISCLDPVNSTGICPHFDPDGPGPLGDLNADFAATGSITITQLDPTGYDVTVDELTFSDGTQIVGLRMLGS